MLTDDWGTQHLLGPPLPRKFKLLPTSQASDNAQYFHLGAYVPHAITDHYAGLLDNQLSSQ